MTFKKIKLTVSAVLITIIFACLAAFAVACSNGNNGSNGGAVKSKETQYLPSASAVGVGHGCVVCSVEGYENAKDDWLAGEPFELLTSKAKTAVVADLVVGEKYYLVYTAKLPYEKVKKYYSQPVNQNKNVTYTLNVDCELSGADSIWTNENIIEAEFVEQNEVSENNYCDYVSFLQATPYAHLSVSLSNEMGNGITICLVISIIPKAEGELSISCGYRKRDSDDYHTFYCNVNSRETLDSGMKVKVENLKTFFENESDYPDGVLPDNYKAQNNSSVRFSMDESYYNFIRFDLTPLGDYTGGKVYCAVTLNGSTVSFSVDSAGTGDYHTASDGTDFFGFGINDGANKKKTITVCFKLLPMTDGESTVHISIFGKGVAVQGVNRTDEKIETYKVTYDNEKDGYLTYLAQSNSYSVLSVTDKYAETIIIPDTFNGKPVTGIAEGAFVDSRVKQVTIGNNVTIIGKNAFNGCEYLQKVTIDGGNSLLEEVGDYAFNKCSKLEMSYLPTQVKKIGDYAFAYCELFEEFTLPASLEKIGKCAFMRTALEKVHIPAKVNSIGAGAFANCLSIYVDGSYKSAFCSLKSITISPSNKNFVVEDGVLYNADKTVLKQFPTGSDAANFTVPDGVKEIEAYAFCVDGSTIAGRVYSPLHSLTIPESVNVIGEYAIKVNVTYYHTVTITILGDSDWELRNSNKLYDTKTLAASEVNDSIRKYYEYIWTKKV